MSNNKPIKSTKPLTVAEQVDQLSVGLSVLVQSIPRLGGAISTLLTVLVSFDERLRAIERQHDPATLHAMAPIAAASALSVDVALQLWKHGPAALDGLRGLYVPALLDSARSEFMGIAGTCKSCGALVASYTCNKPLTQQIPEAAPWDGWLACVSPLCEHAGGEGYFQDSVDWCEYRPGED